MANGTDIPSDWYVNAFGELYPILYAHRDASSAERESCFAIEETALQSSDLALDLCCGNGRHLTHVLRCAPSAIGVDYSVPLLRLARQAVGSSGRLLRADMRALPFLGCFDVVFSFFTSFGYFLEDFEDHKAARAMAGALKKGGRFFMDFLNAPSVETNLIPHSERFFKDWRIVEERWIDRDLQRVNKQTVVFREDDWVGDTVESVRLYTLDELSALLQSVGLEISGVFGDYDRKPLDDSCPRLIVVGHRKHGHAIDF
jgi:SAM-dependent methyltransferase